jgi:hypothetical protein
MSGDDVAAGSRVPTLGLGEGAGGHGLGREEEAMVSGVIVWRRVVCRQGARCGGMVRRWCGGQRGGGRVVVAVRRRAEWRRGGGGGAELGEVEAWWWRRTEIGDFSLSPMGKGIR